MIKQLRLFSTLLLLAVASVLWAEETVYKTALFGTDYNAKNSSYTSSFEATNGDFTVVVNNFNNNNNGWTNSNGLGQIKCGRKNYTSVGSIVTKAAVDKAVSKVVVTIDAITTDKVNSIKLYTSADNSTWTEAGSFDMGTGTKEVSLSTPTANWYYKVEFDCASGSSNGLVTVSKVEYYINEGGSATDPSIEADNVDIAYDATSGSIAYTIKNPTSETLSATTTSDWLTLGTVGASPITFTCSANSGKTARTATVTLTYGTARKNVIVTQAANPNAVDNISDITAAGIYAVQGTIVAKSQRGFVVGDGTGYVYYYNKDYTQADYNVGDKVKLSGSVVAYGGVFEFNNTTDITPVTESNYVAEEPTVLTGAQMDSRVASTTPAQLSNYVQFEGTLSVSGTYYNITQIDGASTAKGSISYPLNTDFTSLNGKTVKVTGYYVGVSSSTYYNIMLGSIEEVEDATPIIDANDVALTYDATEGEITYTIGNVVEGGELTASVTPGDWLTLGELLR